jgi:hypothetical protein
LANLAERTDRLGPHSVIGVLLHKSGQVGHDGRRRSPPRKGRPRALRFVDPHSETTLLFAWEKGATNGQEVVIQFLPRENGRELRG